MKALPEMSEALATARGGSVHSRSASAPLPTRPKVGGASQRSVLWQAGPRRRRHFGRIFLGLAAAALLCYHFAPALVSTPAYNPFADRISPSVPAAKQSPPRQDEFYSEEKRRRQQADTVQQLNADVAAHPDGVAVKQPSPPALQIQLQDKAKPEAAQNDLEAEARWHAAKEPPIEEDVPVEHSPAYKKFQPKPALDEQSGQSKAQSQPSPGVTTTSLAAIEASLRAMLQLIPEGFEAAQMLEPIAVSGVARMRETGIRTRQYRKRLEVWEDLHLVLGEKFAYVRDDILQYVKEQPKLLENLDLSYADFAHSYGAFRHFVTSLGHVLFPYTAPYFASHTLMRAQMYQGGRGIVLSGGNDQISFLYAQIQVFRKLGSKLPIEVMYLGDDDLKEEYRDELEALGDVTTRDISLMVVDKGWQIKGWAGKPWSMLTSSFSELSHYTQTLKKISKRCLGEMIFIDADSLFFQKPDVLFDHPDYKRTGTLFFKDRLMMPESKRSWLREFLPPPYSPQVKASRPWQGLSAHYQESGVVVMDKFQHLLALLMVSRMNGPDRDGNSEKGITGVYELVYGDKETYWLGFELVGDSNYAFHSGAAGILGSINDTRGTDEEQLWTICGPQLLHLDENNRPLWYNGWLLKTKFIDNEVKGEPVDFDHYMREATISPVKNQWELHESNICCLTADQIYDFTTEERQNLDEMVVIAQDAAARYRSLSR